MFWSTIRDMYWSVMSAIPTPYDVRVTLLTQLMYYGHQASIPLITQIKMAKNGFGPLSYFLYDFSKYDMNSYISDYMVEVHTHKVNDDNTLTANKIKFYDLLGEYGYREYCAELYANISRNDSEDFKVKIEELLESESIVLKPTGGSGGEGIYLVEHEGGKYLLDRKETDKKEILNYISTLEEYVISEYCEQAQYAKSIYPKSANTIRAVTMRPDCGPAFLARAVHRFGANGSGFVDNFSKGGISTPIDETGRIGRGVRKSGLNVTWHDQHPQTGSEIEGVSVPGWDEIKQQLISMADVIKEVRYIGWDIIVTADGEFKIIEGNGNTDVDLLQAHGPLLTEPRIRQFYSENGVPV